MKVVGILLVSALLVIPPAAARSLARTPEQMVLLASATGVISVLLGLWASFRFDTPAGPSVVVAATALFAFSLVLQSLRDARRPA
jgi:zinc transport system permease protein